MSKKKTTENSRLDKYTEDVVKARRGDPADLLKELDAMRSFFKMYETSYAEEEDPRLAMVMALLADLTGIVGLYIACDESASH